MPSPHSLDKLRSTTGETLVSVTLAEMVEAFLSETPGKRLLLPTIQRGLVWRNEQIINYWDSLLRGWFPGVMLVHERAESDATSYSSQGLLQHTHGDDLLLFDGQQRMAAILLGFGEGPLARTHRLWVDFDTSNSAPFRLRISTVGQPFGYDPGDPNRKLALDVRNRRWQGWFQGEAAPDLSPGDRLRQRALGVLGLDRSSAPLAGRGDKELSALLRELAFDFFRHDIEQGRMMFPLAPIIRHLLKTMFVSKPLTCGRDYAQHQELQLDLNRMYQADAADALQRYTKFASVDPRGAAFQRALDAATRQDIAVKKLDRGVLNAENYVEYFKRVGQGGTALSEEELCYSLIKSAFPQSRGAIEAIAVDIGRLASPAEIALAALRLVRMQEVSASEPEWKRAGKPNATWTQQLAKIGEASTLEASGLTEDSRQRIHDSFAALLAPVGDKRSPLHGLMIKVRDLLAENSDRHPTGFPRVLLGRLPKGLVELALILVGHEKLAGLDLEIKRALSLWAVTFGSPDPLTRQIANRVTAPEPLGDIDARWLGRIVRLLEAENKAKPLPSAVALARGEAWPPESLGPPAARMLLKGEERYAFANNENGKGSQTLRDLNFWSSEGKNALLWLQRDYLNARFGHYDPTSDRDEDLPIDLDHVVSQACFDFDWGNRLDLPSGAMSDAQLYNLRHYRRELGNSLGNLRWLCASENRKRGKGRGAALADDRSGVFAAEELRVFSQLLEKLQPDGRGMDNWTVEDLMAWQDIVVRRTARLVRVLIDDSGIRRLRIPEDPAVPSS